MVFTSCLLLAFTAGSLTFIPRQTQAVTSELDVNLEIESIISLSLTPDVNLSITPVLAGQQQTANTTATVSTNNSTGYHLDMNAQYDTVSSLPGTSLIHTNNTNTIPSSSNTSAAALASNTWGYGMGANQVTFLAIPALSSPATLKNTAVPVDNEETTVTIGAKADMTLPIGVYSGALVFTAAANPVPVVPRILSASGIMRGGNTLTITGENLENITTLTVGGAPCYIQPGANTATQVACTLPTSLAAGTQRILLTNALGTATYLVVYISDTDFTAAMCAAMPNYNPSSPNPLSTTTITDNRNNQTYRIRKMQDGKCWMISNLHYLPANNAASPGAPYPPATVGNYMTVDGTTNQSTANSDTPRYADPGGSIDYSSETFYGLLYNWYGATAGTGTYARADDEVTESSICPSPFRLPTGNIDSTNAATLGDFGVLDQAMGGEGINIAAPTAAAPWVFSGPWSGVLSGSWRNNIGTQGDFGVYWSSTAHSSSTYARTLYFDPEGINPGTNFHAKYYGRAIRCVL